jgi:hypothetical protein
MRLQEEARHGTADVKRPQDPVEHAADHQRDRALNKRSGTSARSSPIRSRFARSRATTLAAVIRQRMRPAGWAFCQWTSRPRGVEAPGAHPMTRPISGYPPKRPCARPSRCAPLAPAQDPAACPRHFPVKRTHHPRDRHLTHADSASRVRTVPGEPRTLVAFLPEATRCSHLVDVEQSRWSRTLCSTTAVSGSLITAGPGRRPARRRAFCTEW